MGRFEQTPSRCPYSYFSTSCCPYSSPHDLPPLTQNLRNVKANQVSSAVHDLIKAVSPLDEADLMAAGPDNMVTNIMEVGSHNVYPTNVSRL